MSVFKTLGSAVVFVLTAVLVVGALTPPQRAQAADLSQFSAGNIISDAKFFDGYAWTSDQVQAFLDQKVPNCEINNGDPTHAANAPYWWNGRLHSYIADACLKNYRQTTPNMAEQPGFCNAYTGAYRETGAQIIARVGQACGISPKVLLVLLQKEQQLVTDTWPTWKQLEEATGFECYDNGQACVGNYSTFFHQVWAAARQLKRYGTAPFTWYPVGRASNILYQANNPGCGTKSVFIENRATAALYYYTPYTPNQAALNAGYGIGDSCSAYGNRNFYQMYVDWFGSTQGSNENPVAVKYNELGGASSFLGTPTSAISCGLRNGGCYQHFQNGVILYSNGTGAHTMTWPVRSIWAQGGYQNGYFGYPTSDANPNNGNYVQTFESGNLTVTNGIATATSIGDPWLRAVVANSWLGEPTNSRECGLRNYGCFQHFQNGVMLYSASTGSHALTWAVREVWASTGYQNGSLGYPTSDPNISTNNYVQNFEKGSVTVTNGVARITASPDPWVPGVINNPWIGTATNNRECGLRNYGCYQHFQNGVVLYSVSTGSHAITWPTRNLWAATGFQNGYLGYPTSDPDTNSNNYVQTFERGVITVTNGVPTSTNVSDPWTRGLITNWWVGSPTGERECGLRNYGCYQHFQNGVLLYSVNTGTHALNWTVRNLWATTGFQNGSLGYPTNDPDTSTNTYTQTFERGRIEVTNGTPRIVY